MIAACQGVSRGNGGNAAEIFLYQPAAEFRCKGAALAGMYCSGKCKSAAFAGVNDYFGWTGALMLTELPVARPKMTKTVSNTKNLFIKLARIWREETAVLSSTTMICTNRYYQQIIGLGPDVVPLILEDLAEEVDHWFWALQAITRENPVDPSDVGNMEKMRQAWLRWGRERGCTSKEYFQD